MLPGHTINMNPDVSIAGWSVKSARIKRNAAGGGEREGGRETPSVLCIRRRRKQSQSRSGVGE